MIVAERELSGYPDTHVRIEANFTDDTHTVIVSDTVGDFVLANAVGRERAKDAYFHPFAFGYIYGEPAYQIEEGT